MNNSNDRSVPGLGGLKDSGRAIPQRPEFYRLFDSTYNELNHLRGNIDNGGDSEQAREAKEGILYFARLLNENRMLDYIVKICHGENPPES